MNYLVAKIIAKMKIDLLDKFASVQMRNEGYYCVEKFQFKVSNKSMERFVTHLWPTSAVKPQKRRQKNDHDQ